jgi:hypothetical protein
LNRAGQVAQAKAAAQRQAEVAQVKKDGEAAFYHDGWFGVYNDGSAIATISEMPDDSPLTAQLHASIPTMGHVAVLSVRNGTPAAIDVDTRKSIIYFSDGTRDAGLDALAMLQTATKDRDDAVRAFAPPYHIESGHDLTQGLFFFPAAMDFHRLSKITIWMNGHALEINGRMFTSAEKKQLAEQGKQKAGK